MNSGIYKIVNLINGCIYIGSAIDLKYQEQNWGYEDYSYHFKFI